MLPDDNLGVFPERETYTSSGIAYCFMFYDWEKPVVPDWLETAQTIFAQFGQTIFEGTGSLGGQHSHGRFGRVKKKLAGFLGAVHNKTTSDFFDIRVWSQHYVKSDAFFPCDIEMVWSVNASGRKKGMIAVRDTLVDGLEPLIQQIGKNLFDMTGVMYAHALCFPTLFGPDSYLASVGTIPSGMSSTANKKYYDRITQWRDNRWSGLLGSQGYLREVYPINFVLDSHLNMPFQGRPLSEYMKKVGNLKVTEYNDKIYRWTVPAERLEKVRQDLEPSGLVLSSPHPPLRSRHDNTTLQHNENKGDATL